jgi:hypothetical protein
MAFDRVDHEPSDRLLARLTTWWASRPDLANRPRIPLGDWLAISSSERQAIWQVGIDAVRNLVRGRRGPRCSPSGPLELWPPCAKASTIVTSTPGTWR